MNRRLTAASALALCVALTGWPAAVRAQQASSSSSTSAQTAPITLKVTVTISRYQKEQKVGSLPFVLMVIPATGTTREEGGSTATIQMGAEVPVPAGKDGSYSYRSVGTSITSTASRLGDTGAYSISLAVSDSQIMSNQAENGLPRAFQSFSSSSRVVLRDGQSIQYTAASDKASGETARIDVMMNVVK